MMIQSLYFFVITSLLVGFPCIAFALPPSNIHGNVQRAVDNGKETQNSWFRWGQQKAHDAYDTADEAKNKAKDTVKGQVDKAYQRAEESKEQLKRQAELARSRVEEGKEQLKTQAEKMRGKVEEGKDQAYWKAAEAKDKAKFAANEQAKKAKQSGNWVVRKWRGLFGRE